MTDERQARRVLRGYVRAIAPCIVLGGVVFVLIYLVFLPRPDVKLDLARARVVVSRQWLVPILVVHVVLVMTGMLLPWVRGDRPGRAALAGLAALPSIWLHVVAAQIMVVLGLVAGIVPGMLALAPVALIGAAVAGGARGRDALDAASAAVRPRRWPATAIVVGLIVVEVGLTIAAWKAIVPPLDKKTPAAALMAASRFAYINAIRTAITAPLVATLLAVLYASWTPQAASAARTAPASAHATTA